MPIKRFGNTYREPIPHTRREDPYGTPRKFGNPHNRLIPDPKELLEVGVVFWLLYKAFGGIKDLLNSIYKTIGETAQKSIEGGAQLLGYKNSTDMINQLQGKADFDIVVEKDYLLVSVNKAQISKIVLPPEEKGVLKAIDIIPNTLTYMGTQYNFFQVENSVTATIIYDILMMLQYYSTYWTSFEESGAYRPLSEERKATFECTVSILCGQQVDALAHFCLIWYWELTKNTLAKSGRKNNIRMFTQNCLKWDHFNLDEKTAWLLAFSK